MDTRTQAQIAYVLFYRMLRGEAITPEQEKQLVEWLREKSG